MAFEVGDVVGELHNDGTTVRIRIEQVSEDGSIFAKVIVLGNFFSAERLRGAFYETEGFVLGEVLKLVPTGNPGSWIISIPKFRPWHILSEINGKKEFCPEYR